MALSLTVEKGEPAGAVFLLKPGENTVGRSRSATVQLGAADVSGVHARIRVDGDAAFLQNESRFGTMVDTQEVKEPVRLIPGQRVYVGKSTVLLFAVAEGPESEGAAGRTSAVPTRGTLPAKPGSIGGIPPVTKPPADDAATGKAPRTGEPAPLPGEEKTGSLPPAAAARGVAAAREAAGADAEGTGALSRANWAGGEESSAEMTRAMQTRAASPEEIDYLKEMEQKRIRRRIVTGLLIVIPLLVLVIIFRPRTPPPETEFEWPKDANGEYLDAYEPAPSGGRKEGGFDLCYPGVPSVKKGTIPGGVAIECKIGRNLDVPMRIVLQEEMDKRFIEMDRKAVVEDWMQTMTASGGRWNFDKPAPAVSFTGKENGVPYTRVSYQRDGNGSWFGVASVVRHGYRRITVRAEAPATESARAERILSAKFMLVSPDFERGYWEPVTGAAELPPDIGLRQARLDLERMAPATWMELERLLCGLLTQFVRADNVEAETEALRLLARLREREALWYNSQQLAFDAAVMQGNRAKAQRIAEFSKAVFSNMEDQRYYSVRKWNTEP